MPHPARQRALVATLLGTVLIVGACKGTDQQAVGGETGGTVVIATAADAGTMLPGLVNGITDREVTDLLYDRLADIGTDLNTVGDKGFTPQLSDKWEWSADSLSIAFHINPNARWHDGQAVRANDVRYSVGLVKDASFGSPAAPLVTNLDSVSVKDSLTAVAWFKRRTPEQFYDLVYQIAIVPEHVLSSTPAAQLKTADIGRKGIGSGRFRLAKWEPGVRIELVADTVNYRGRPKLDRVVWAVSPDFNAAVTRFFAGDADIFENLRPEQIPQIAKDSSRRTLRLPTLSFNYLAFNLKDPKNTAKPHPIFGDRQVRRALSMAVDRRAMLKNVFDTLAQIAQGPFAHSVGVADSTLALIPFDTVRARALLDSAGWRVGADGIRAKNGVRLAFAITTPNSSAARHSYAVLMQEGMRRVGADVKLDEPDFPGYMQKLASHGFDAEMANFGLDPSVSGFKQIWATAGIGKDGNNFYQYSNPSVDALLDSAANAFDPSRTRSYAKRAFQTVVDDAPGIWLYEPPTIAGIHKRIHVAKVRADAYFSGMGEWSIPANERTERDRIGLRPAP